MSQPKGLAKFPFIFQWLTVLREQCRSKQAALYILFFVSGFPALFYQLVWQRVLHTLFGVNIESITMVVAAFMLGLGLGSLLGSYLSKKRQSILLYLFAWFELVIGCFGVFSIKFFMWVGDHTVMLPNTGIIFVLFTLVCLPTILMGASLPILSTYIVRRINNVGISVSNLYFVNTLGSGIACLLAAFFVMRSLGQSGTVLLAAILNALVGLGALLFARKLSEEKNEIDEKIPASRDKSISFTLPYALSALAGYLTLSYEIIWMRVYSFASGSLASVFAFVLAFYLLGLAFGGHMAKYFCGDFYNKKSRQSTITTLFVVLLITAVAAYVFLPSVALISPYRTYVFTFSWLGTVTALFGFTLPLLSQSAIPPYTNAGREIGRIYFFNVLGATTGCIVTGFYLMNVFSISQINLLTTFVVLLLAIGVFQLLKTPIKSKTFAFAAIFGLGSLMYVLNPYLYHDFYEKLQYKSNYTPEKHFAHVIENKQGVITISHDKFVYGGGVYDGQVRTDLVQDNNFVVRAYALAAIHPHPKDLLIIGLSMGAWAQVLANMPGVEKVTIVEINPGYLKLIPEYPEVASLLKNPKVNIIIDDGRRWLKRHPGTKFDAIVMNTTFHARDHASSLLSKGFLNLARHSLKEGGIFYYNTTNSKEALHTAAEVFPYAMKILSFVAVSDKPIIPNKKRWEKILKSYTIENKKVFDLSQSDQRERFKQVLDMVDAQHKTPVPTYGMEPKDSFIKRVKTAGIITDDNMGTEWYY